MATFATRREPRSKTHKNHSATSRNSRRGLFLERLEDRRLLAGEVFPNDPLFSTQWALHNTGQSGGIPDADLDAPEAWSVTTGSLATVIAVLDMGVDYTDPDLYLNIWLNEGEIPEDIAASLFDTDSDGLITFHDLNDPLNASSVIDINANGYIDGGDLLADPTWENGVDEDSNGRTDDLVGWDFHGNDNDVQPEVVGGIYQSHGTDQAKQIGAMTNNGLGTAGINWNVRLIPVRILSVGGLGSDIVNANAAAGIDYAVASGAPISNNSWRAADGGYVYSQEIYDAIDRARLAGHLFIGGAGNDGTDNDVSAFYPSSYALDNVISATRVDGSNQLPANFGLTSVDLGVSHYGGTSGASSYTSGVAALLKSAHPDWTYAQIKDRILATVDPLPSLAGKTVTGGRLNAAHAVGVVYMPSDPDFPQQWELDNTGQTGGVPDADIDAPEAWTVTTGSMTTVLAEIDDGVDYTQPDLYLNIWLNQGEIPAALGSNLTDADNDGIITFRDLNSPTNASFVSDLNGNSYIDAGDLLADPSWENGLDEDGNGFGDDLVGWDFEDNDNDPIAIGSHGTGMALYIGADANNGVAGAGINWRISMMPVRFWNRANPVDFTKMAAGLDYAVAEGAPISALYGGNYDYSQTIYDSINAARLANHLVIAPSANDSANNDVTPRYPASFDLPNIISAMSVNQYNEVDAVWNYGAISVDLAAPTQMGGGTSGGAARTAGVAALLKSVHPDWTYAQIKDRILATVDPLPSLAGKTVTGGRLNAANALGVAQFSISNATATEGDNSPHFRQAFVEEGSGGLLRPRTLTFRNGFLFVPDENGDSVNRYDASTGAFIDQFVSSDPALNGGLDRPHAAAFGPGGDLYVISFNTDDIRRYDGITGDFEGIFVSAGSGGLSLGQDLAFDSAGNLYVTTDLTHEVLRYDTSGNPFPGPSGTAGTAVFVPAGSGGLLHGRGIVFDASGNLYVASIGNDRVLKYSGATGASLGTFVTAGAGGLDEPHSLTFGPDGNLYVGSSNLDSVFRFSGVNGQFIDTYVSTGSGGLDNTIGITFDSNGRFYAASGFTAQVLQYSTELEAIFTVTLSAPSSMPVTVDFATNPGTATVNDYTETSGTITFAPGQRSRTIFVQTLDDTTYEGNETFVVNLSNPIGGVIVDGQGEATIVENDPLPTKFYVVDDATANQTFEYGASGAAVENYLLNSGNTSPRGAASTVAGDKTWVVDANKKVYVYDTSGGLLGSWTAGTLASNATVEGIATNGTDVWIVDARQDKVFKYTGAASRLSGSQNAASSFSLNSGNKEPRDIVTDGTSLWVVNNSSTDKVFKYSLTGAHLGNWTITGGGGSPTGITLDPASPSHLWIVDNVTDRVYQYDNTVGKISGSQGPSGSFALAGTNLNPQGIADPPVAGEVSSATAAADAGPPRWDGRLLGVDSRQPRGATSAVDQLLTSGSDLAWVDQQPARAPAGPQLAATGSDWALADTAAIPQPHGQAAASDEALLGLMEDWSLFGGARKKRR